MDLFQLSIVDILKVSEYAQDSGGSRGGSGGSLESPSPPPFLKFSIKKEIIWSQISYENEIVWSQ